MKQIVGTSGTQTSIQSPLFNIVEMGDKKLNEMKTTVNLWDFSHFIYGMKDLG